MNEYKNFRVQETKFDYFFGRVTSSKSNQRRSRQNLDDLAQLGIQEDDGGQERLIELFQEGLTAEEFSRVEDEYGVTIRRKVRLQNGDVEGDVIISYLYRDGDVTNIPEVTTLIPRIYR